MPERISGQFELDLKELKDQLLLMGGLIESMMDESLEALIRADVALAEKVIRRDNDVDQMEKQIDQTALEILAVRQPTAGDLRFVTSSFKICTDLERMGDILVNICERICEIARITPNAKYEILPRMMKQTKAQIAKALDAFVNLSAETASDVLKGEAQIDAITREAYDAILVLMKESPDNVERGMKLFFIAKHLERMADHATNIAEQVVFVVKGLDIRHSRTPGPTPYTV